MISFTHFISIMPPVFKSTIRVLWYFLTVFSKSSSPWERRYAPGIFWLSLSSPALRPITTMATGETRAVFSASSRETGISFCEKGSVPQPVPLSKGFSSSHFLYTSKSSWFTFTFPDSKSPRVISVTFETFTIPPDPVPLL